MKDLNNQNTANMTILFCVHNSIHYSYRTFVIQRAMYISDLSDCDYLTWLRLYLLAWELFF